MKQKKEPCKQGCKDDCCDSNNVCQSCSIPLVEKNKGTNADLSTNHEYCNFCYDKGIFKSPHLTIEQMIDKLVGFHKEMKMAPDEARAYAEKTLWNLKRWKKSNKK